jgi:[ribosomal protein S5]-alanine N-acetyltransferase
MKAINYTLRDFTAEDVDSIVENANNINVSQYLHDRFPYPYTLKDAQEFIEVFLPNQPGKVFAIDVEGKAVGAIGLHLQHDEHRMNAELGYWLGENYWNKGIISSAIPEVVKYGFEKFNLNKIYAKVYKVNKISCIVLVKNGFKLEACLVKNAIKKGQYVDELIYSKFNEEGK